MDLPDRLCMGEAEVRIGFEIMERMEQSRILQCTTVNCTQSLTEL